MENNRKNNTTVVPSEISTIIYSPDVSRTIRPIETKFVDSYKNLPKRIKKELNKVYEFYEKDVYPRKQKYGNYNENIHNIDTLKKRAIFLGKERGMKGSTPIFSAQVSSKRNNYLTPIVIHNKRNVGQTLVHEFAHAEDIDTFTDKINDKNDYERFAGSSLNPEEVDALNTGYVTKYNTPELLGEKLSTNREFRYLISQKTNLFNDDLTEYIKSLSYNKLKRFYKSLNSDYKIIMKKPSRKGLGENNIKNSLIQVANGNTTNDTTKYVKQGGTLPYYLKHFNYNGYYSRRNIL